MIASMISGKMILNVSPPANDQASFFEQDQLRSHRAGIRGHASGQFTLCERMASCERCQENKLIRGHTMFGELRVACPVHRQVSGSQSHRELTFVHHTAPGTYLDTGCTSCVHARSESLVLPRWDCNHLGLHLCT